MNEEASPLLTGWNRSAAEGGSSEKSAEAQSSHVAAASALSRGGCFPEELLAPLERDEGRGEEGRGVGGHSCAPAVDGGESSGLRRKQQEHGNTCTGGPG